MDMREYVNQKYYIYENGRDKSEMTKIIIKQIMALGKYEKEIENIEFSLEIFSILHDFKHSFYYKEKKEENIEDGKIITYDMEELDDDSLEEIIHGKKSLDVVGRCYWVDYTINKNLSGENWIKVNLK